MAKTIWDEVQEKGIKHDNWCSDLYIPATKENREMCNRYGIYAKAFISQSPEDKGSVWLDVPFQYTPYYSRNVVVK